MNPSPEQWRAFRRAAFDAWLSNKKNLGQYSDAMDCYVEGYVFAKAEQAAEIASLKAQIAELSPLAKFGAMIAYFQFNKDGCSEACIQDTADECGLFLNGSSEYAPNIKATITKLLKD